MIKICEQCSIHKWCLFIKDKEPEKCYSVEIYNMGATDQRKVDIEKALQVYSDLLSANGYNLGSINAEMARMKKALLKD